MSTRRLCNRGIRVRAGHGAFRAVDIRRRLPVQFKVEARVGAGIWRGSSLARGGRRLQIPVRVKRPLQIVLVAVGGLAEIAVDAAIVVAEDVVRDSGKGVLVVAFGICVGWCGSGGLAWVGAVAVRAAGDGEAGGVLFFDLGGPDIVAGVVVIAADFDGLLEAVFRGFQWFGGACGREIWVPFNHGLSTETQKVREIAHTFRWRFAHI